MPPAAAAAVPPGFPPASPRRWDPLNTGGPTPTARPPPEAGWAPQGPRGGSKTPQGTARDAPPAKAVPIWLGSGTRQVAVVVPDIRQVVPEELQLSEAVIAIERFEADARLHEEDARHTLAAECLEQGISARRRLFGDAHEQFSVAVERFIELCNVWGMWCLSCGHYTSSLELLKKAERMTEASSAPGLVRRVALRAETFVNLCCYFRHRGKPNAALQFAEKALKIEGRYKDADGTARTRLNYAVLLSSAGRHVEAADCIETAAALLHDLEGRLALGGGAEAGRRRQEASSALAVAHHNMFVELSHLGRQEDAIDSLHRARSVARRTLGPGHSMTRKMEEACLRWPEPRARCPAEAPDAAAQAERPPPAGAAALRASSGGGGPPAPAGRGAPPSARRRPGLRPLDEAMAELVDRQKVTLRFAELVPQPPAARRPGEQPAFRRPGKQAQASRVLLGPAGQGRPREPLFGSRPKLSPDDQWWCSKMARAPSSARARPTAAAGAAAPGAPPRAATPEGGPAPGAGGPRPGSPHLQAAYEYHWRQASLRAAEAEPEAPPDAARLHAIGVLRGRLDDRRGRGLPRPTGANCVRAATRIQASFRGFLTRQWRSEELAKDARRVGRSCGEAAAAPAPADGGAPPPARGDEKRRVALRVVRAARRARVERAAAVRVQKAWRGWAARRDIQAEVARVAHDACARIQAVHRGACARAAAKRDRRAAVRLQAAARLWLALRQVQAQRRSALAITLAARGCLARGRLRAAVRAAVRLQAAGRGLLARRHQQRRLRGALVLQRVLRGASARRRLCRAHACARRLQAAWRGRSAREALARRWRAAAALQALWRARRARRALEGRGVQLLRPRASVATAASFEEGPEPSSPSSCALSLTGLCPALALADPPGSGAAGGDRAESVQSNGSARSVELLATEEARAACSGGAAAAGGPVARGPWELQARGSAAQQLLRELLEAAVWPLTAPLPGNEARTVARAYLPALWRGLVVGPRRAEARKLSKSVLPQTYASAAAALCSGRARQGAA